jgi:hypothetical protein
MTRNAGTADAIGLAALLILLAGLWYDAARACSLVDVAASRAESMALARYYWAGSALLGGMCIAAAWYRGRWPVTSAVVAAALNFHPAWTVAPVHGPDCTFANVEASQAVLTVIAVLLSYHLFRVFKAKVASRSNPRPDAGP